MPTPQPIENPLTEVMEEAEKLIREQEVELFAQFGIPLYVDRTGKRARVSIAFPKTPDGISPEALQELIDVHGEDAVTQWMVDSLQEPNEENE